MKEQLAISSLFVLCLLLLTGCTQNTGNTDTIPEGTMAEALTTLGG
jgi:hypothetical protein